MSEASEMKPDEVLVEDVITPGSNKIEEIKMNFGGLKLTEDLKKLMDE